VALLTQIHTTGRSKSFVSFRSPYVFYLLTVGVKVVYFSLDHTQTHTTVGRTHLYEGSARRGDLYLTTQTLTGDKHPCPRGDSNPRFQQALDRRPTPQPARPLRSAEAKVLGEKPLPPKLCLSQFSHDLSGERTRTSTVKSRRLTDRAMGKPTGVLLKNFLSPLGIAIEALRYKPTRCGFDSRWCH
jgi:hypothetical protein